MSPKPTSTECCPEFKPSTWDNKKIDWKDKKFIRAKVFTLMYMPLNFGSVITRLMGSVDSASATCQDNLCLSEHTSPWNMNIYLAVDKVIPHVDNLTVTGSFITKVYEGDFKNTGIWCKDFESHIKNMGKQLHKMFLWYTTCPACAKKYGKNYVVIFGQTTR